MGRPGAAAFFASALASAFTPSSARAEDESSARARELRLAVAALVSGAKEPTTDELLRAVMLAEGAVRIAQRQPWGYAARCDIARRWGDPRLIDKCLADLQRVAPAHEETRRALLARGQWTPWALRAGWAALALLVLGTAGHAVRAGVRRRAAGRGRSITSAAIAIVISTALAGQVAGAPPEHKGRFVINDADPASSVPTPEERNARPLEFGNTLQDLIARAQAATGRADHRSAARYYVALAKAVPDRATAFSKLCESLEAAGERDRALQACGLALEREGVVANDYLRFARLTLARPGDLPPGDAEKVKSMIGHLTSQPDVRVFGFHIQCELALRVDDLGQLERCTAGLAADAPSDGKTIAFQWALAMKKGQRDEALRLIERAKAAGVKLDGILRMEQATSRFGFDLRVLIAAALALAAGALVFSRRRSSSTMTTTGYKK